MSASFLSQLEQHELLFTNVPGTFANESYLDRLPKLVQDVAQQNAHRLSAAQLARLQSLADDMINNARIPLPSEFSDLPDQKDAPTSQHWTELLQDKGYTWQNAPWFLSEQYLFHLVLVVAGYYVTGIDPFHVSKCNELAEDTPWKLLQSAVEVSAAEVASPKSRHEQLKRLMKLCLWGNKADGCYKQVKDMISGVDATLAVEDKYLLVDDSDKVIAYLERVAEAKQSQPISVQYINDNCGTELLLDLALADHLLTHKWCTSMTFNVKAEPMYVSDATPVDVKEHVEAMLEPSCSPKVQALGRRLSEYMASGRIIAKPDVFFNLYSFYWEIPQELSSRLVSEASLVILKGDLNYRRLLGDRMWPASTPVEQAVPFFPTPFVSFRTLKSNPIVGIPREIEQKLDVEDPKWRYNGKRGIIQSVLDRAVLEG